MASILVLSADLSGSTAWTNVLTALGHTATYNSTSGGFGALDLSSYDIIVREESQEATQSLVTTNPVHAAKLREWVNAGGKFVNIGNEYDPTDQEGGSWYPTSGVTIGNDIGGGFFTFCNTMAPQATFLVSAMVVADMNNSGAGDVFGWGTFTATGGLTSAVLDTDSSTRPTCIYGACGDGRVIYSLIADNTAPWAGSQTEHMLTDFLNWLVSGAIPGGGTGQESGTPGSAGADETGFFCPAEGSVVESTGHSAFNPALALDLEVGKAYRWTNLPFTCGLTVPQTCAASFEKPDGLYFGTRNSRVAIFGRENVYFDGPWQRMILSGSTAVSPRLTVSAGAAGSVTVSGGSLSTHGDRLAGMTCTLIKNYGTSSETRQERTILWNSATVILVSWALTGEGENWTSNPASGDVLIIGLIRPYIEPMEIHTADASYPGSLRADYNLESSSVTSATIAIQRQVYTASGRRKSVGTSRATAAATRISTLDEIDNEPEGMGITPAAGFKAHIERITWDQPACELVFRQLEKDVVK